MGARFYSAFTDDTQKYSYEAKLLEELSLGNNAEVKKMLFALHPADIADFIDKLTVDQRDTLLTLVKSNLDGNLLLELDGSVKRYVMSFLGAKKTASVIKNLTIDNIINVLIGTDEAVKNEILKYLPVQTRSEVVTQLSYPEDSVGRIMNHDFVSVPEHWTVNQAMDYLRKLKDLPEDFYEIFIVNPKFTPVGSLTLGKILNNQKNVIISDIMKPNLETVKPETSAEEICYQFRQYGYVTLPVVNKDNRIIGAVNIDDIIDIMQKEAEEDIMLMGGVHDTDFHSDIFLTLKARFPWLFINLITASLSAFVIGYFEGTIEHIIVLASIMPIVCSMGGNAGTQTMAISLIAVTSKEISRINISRALAKQLLACVFSGAVIAAIGGVSIALFQQNIHVGLIFAIALIMNFVLAGFFGTMLPIILKKLSLDPLISSPILMTAITDIGGVLLFLGLATLFLL